jgi:hypothetical protein
MARELLTNAADEVDTAKEAIPDPEARDRLETLVNRLRSQADREATPALGVLDRIHVKLRDIERQTDETTVTEAIERAREDVLAFLETLDDRGMKQHGWTENEGANGSA